MAAVGGVMASAWEFKKKVAARGHLFDSKNLREPDAAAKPDKHLDTHKNARGAIPYE